MKGIFSTIRSVLQPAPVVWNEHDEQGNERQDIQAWKKRLSEQLLEDLNQLPVVFVDS